MLAEHTRSKFSDLERRFHALRERAAAGQSFDQALADVHAFVGHPALRGICELAARRTAWEPQEQADLVQAALLDLQQKLRRGFARGGPLLGYRDQPGREPGACSGWVYRIVKNACTSAFRHSLKWKARERGNPGLLAEVPANLDTTWEAEEQARAVARGIERLDPEVREVLLGYLAGKSGNELARALNTLPSRVSKLKHRGIAELRRLLNRVR